jgi:hypothetical protein
MAGCTSSGSSVLTHNLSESLSGATTAKIDINRYSGNLTIDRLASAERLLANGTLPYLDNQELSRSVDTISGQAILTLKTSAAKQSGFRLPWETCADVTEWQIHLNPSVPSDIKAYSSGGNVKLNLAGMAVTGAVADTGGGNIDLVLPDNAANLNATARTGGGNVTVEVGSGTTGSSTVTANSGAGNVVVRVPEGIAARIHATSGMGKVIVDSRFNKIDDNTFQSTDYDSATNKVEITVGSGAGDVSINKK